MDTRVTNDSVAELRYYLTSPVNVAATQNMVMNVPQVSQQELCLAYLELVPSLCFSSFEPRLPIATRNMFGKDSTLEMKSANLICARDNECLL